MIRHVTFGYLIRDELLLISDIRPLWRPALSARVPQCQKLKCRLHLDEIKSVTS